MPRVAVPSAVDASSFSRVCTFGLLFIPNFAQGPFEFNLAYSDFLFIKYLQRVYSSTITAVDEVN